MAATSRAAWRGYVAAHEPHRVVLGSGLKLPQQVRHRGAATTRRHHLAPIRLVGDDLQGRCTARVSFTTSARSTCQVHAKQAGQRENVLAVMGHSKDGLTFGIYSKARLVELKRECVEPIELPRAKAAL